MLRIMCGVLVQAVILVDNIAVPVRKVWMGTPSNLGDLPYDINVSLAFRQPSFMERLPEDQAVYG